MTQAIDLANAINGFVVGCKQDGIWDAIKACCIMAAWDGLDGALYPLKGAAPTNYNFVAGDYNRETGLIGDRSTKYLDSNRNNNSDPQNSRHIALYADIPNNDNRCLIGVRSAGTNTGGAEIRHTATTYCNPSTDTATTTAIPSLGLNFLGYSRSISASYESRRNGSSSTISMTSGAPVSTNVIIYTRTDLAIASNARLAFYSIGESLDLTKLDTRVSALITAIGAAIP